MEIIVCWQTCSRTGPYTRTDDLGGSVKVALHYEKAMTVKWTHVWVLEI